MRTVLPLRGALGLAVVLTALTGVGTAAADDPSVSEIQVRLVETRQELNGLYARSAAASERLNGATVALDQARVDLVEHRAEQRSARAVVQEQRDAVAEMTVERLQSGTTGRAVASMLDGSTPDVLLQRASANTAVDEAMTAVLDDLDARQTVLDSATGAVESALADQEAATAQQRAARADISEAISRAEQMQSSAEAERETLLRQLATARDTSVAEVTRAQDVIDERLDRAGPAAPESAAPAAEPPADEAQSPAPAPAPAPAATPPRAKPTPAPKPPSNPAPASGGRVERAIAFARQQLGEPYVWGGAGPSSWDCSGLTMRAWQAAGVSLPHYAGSQFTATRKVPVSQIKRGDLLFWSNGGAGSIYHAAMYLGSGQMIQAPRPGRGVEIVPLTYWIKPDLASRPG